MSESKEVTITVPCTVIRYISEGPMKGFPILMVLDVDDEGKLTLEEAKFEDKHAGCFEDEKE
jgi:hypothetical protein